jgi:hypothetical protein
LLQLHAQLKHCRAEGREQLDELGIVMLKQLAAAAAAEAETVMASISITQLRGRVQQLEDAAAATASRPTSLSGMVCAQVNQREEEAAAAAGPSQLQQQYAALQGEYVQLAAAQEAQAGYCRLLRSRHEQQVRANAAESQAQLQKPLAEMQGQLAAAQVAREAREGYCRLLRSVYEQLWQQHVLLQVENEHLARAQVVQASAAAAHVATAHGQLDLAQLAHQVQQVCCLLQKQREVIAGYANSLQQQASNNQQLCEDLAAAQEAHAIELQQRQREFADQQRQLKARGSCIAQLYSYLLDTLDEKQQQQLEAAAAAQASRIGVEQQREAAAAAQASRIGVEQQVAELVQASAAAEHDAAAREVAQLVAQVHAATTAQHELAQMVQQVQQVRCLLLLRDEGCACAWPGPSLNSLLPADRALFVKAAYIMQLPELCTHAHCNNSLSATASAKELVLSAFGTPRTVNHC